MKKHHIMFACSFFVSLGQNILNFSMIYYLVDSFSFSTGQTGLFIASGQLFYFLGCTLYHRFGSSFNPLKILPFSAALVFLASIPLVHLRIITPVYAFFWLLQLGLSLFWPPVMAWLTEGLDGIDLGRTISYFNRSWMSALIIAPPLAGFLYGWNSQINFFVINFCFLSTLLLLFYVRRNSGTASPSGEDRQGIPEGYQEKSALHRYFGWIAFFCSTLFVGVLITIVPIHIRDGLGYTESTAGMVLFFRCIAGFAGFIILGRFAAWHYNFRWPIILQTGLFLCAFFFLFAGEGLFLYIVIATFYGFISAACITNSVFYSGSTGKNPKKNLAIHEMLLCTALAAGTAGGGLLYQYFGFSGTSLGLMAALGAGLVFMAFLKGHKF
jgi:predicted MFS family arabinose efflux permease